MKIIYEIEKKDNEVVLRKKEDDIVRDEISFPIMAFKMIDSLFMDTYSEILLMKRKNDKNK